MRQELENIRDKYNRITASLADPALSSNPQRIKKLAKERAELEPVVREYVRFMQIEREIGESEEILADPASDADLKGLAEDIATCRIGGLDSYTPPPDNDMPVSAAVATWPEKRLWINFPSSVHLQPEDAVRARAQEILADAGHTGRMWIQISEDLPPGRWRTTFPIIRDAIAEFGKP